MGTLGLSCKTRYKQKSFIHPTMRPWTCEGQLNSPHKLLHRYARNYETHDNYHNMDSALKIMVLEVVYKTYIFALHYIFTGYMRSSMNDIIYYLMARYGQITAADIKQKKIPPGTLVHVTSYICVLQYHILRGEILQ